MVRPRSGRLVINRETATYGDVEVDATFDEHRRDHGLRCKIAAKHRYERGLLDVRDADDNHLSVNGSVHLHVAVAVKVHDDDDEHDNVNAQ